MNMDHCPGLIESLCSTAWVIQPELSPAMSETASVPPQEGWGKQLNYVMAFHRMGVVDVTRRYSKQDLSSRREAEKRVQDARLVMSGQPLVAGAAVAPPARH